MARRTESGEFTYSSVSTLSSITVLKLLDQSKWPVTHWQTQAYLPSNPDCCLTSSACSWWHDMHWEQRWMVTIQNHYFSHIHIKFLLCSYHRRTHNHTQAQWAQVPTQIKSTWVLLFIHFLCDHDHTPLNNSQQSLCHHYSLIMNCC